MDSCFCCSCFDQEKEEVELMVKLGILGVGKIAGAMAATLREMDSAEWYAFASRFL